MVSETAPQLLGDGLNKIHYHFFCLPVPKIKFNCECDKKINAQSASKAHVGETLTTYGIFGLGPRGVRLLLGEYHGVIKKIGGWSIENMHFIDSIDLPHLVVALGRDALGGVLLEVVEIVSGDVPRVDKVACTEAGLWENGTKEGSGVIERNI